VDFVWDNPGEPVPEETFNHSTKAHTRVFPVNLNLALDSLLLFVLGAPHLCGWMHFVMLAEKNHLLSLIQSLTPDACDITIFISHVAS